MASVASASPASPIGTLVDLAFATALAADATAVRFSTLPDGGILVRMCAADEIHEVHRITAQDCAGSSPIARTVRDAVFDYLARLAGDTPDGVARSPSPAEFTWEQGGAAIPVLLEASTSPAEPVASMTLHLMHHRSRPLAAAQVACENPT
ncbi:MAG: hypothetical protein H3C62_00345 [Gemmatimonadaceae bacterium]|nr:hypothetical protein [Gemmatimonadaceae bacterium]